MYTFKNANIHGYFKMLIFIIIVFAFYNGICDKLKYQRVVLVLPHISVMSVYS